MRTMVVSFKVTFTSIKSTEHIYYIHSQMLFTRYFIFKLKRDKYKKVWRKYITYFKLKYRCKTYEPTDTLLAHKSISNNISN